MEVDKLKLLCISTSPHYVKEVPELMKVTEEVYLCGNSEITLSSSKPKLPFLTNKTLTLVCV